MELMEKYANIILTGVNLQEGQNLLIRTEPVHYREASVIAAEAYKRGARYVHVESGMTENLSLYKARIDNSRDEYLDYVPAFMPEFLRLLVEEDWAYIALTGTENPDFLSDLDSKRNTRAVISRSDASKPFLEAVTKHVIQWIVAYLPTPVVAGKIMGMSPGKEAVEKLWEVLTPILYLNKEDPSEIWDNKSKVLKKRAASLTRLKLKEVRFTGPGTDLTAGIPEKAIWAGGSISSAKGVEYSPNIPTEEVFTSPDYRKTEGTVRITRPVYIPSIGREVEGAWLEFREGRVISFGAEKGKDALEQYFKIDPAARYLGEVAFVDSSSPIYQSGRIFHNILFDENASCHIALGAAYPGCLEGGDNMTEEELKSIGLNVSKLHTDFMIGSPEVDVTGKTADGKTVEIIKRGTFTEEFR